MVCDYTNNISWQKKNPHPIFKRPVGMFAAIPLKIHYSEIRCRIPLKSQSFASV